MKNKPIITLTFFMLVTLVNITNAKHFELENEVKKGGLYLDENTNRTPVRNANNINEHIIAQQGHASYIP